MGDVTIGQDASVWYGAVLRGDMAPIVIGPETNLQDGAIVHVDDEVPCIVGRRVGVGHRVILHGCIVEDECLIGMGEHSAQRGPDRHRERGGGRRGDPGGDAGTVPIARHGRTGAHRSPGRRRAGRADRRDLGALRWPGAGPSVGAVSEPGDRRVAATAARPACRSRVCLPRHAVSPLPRRLSLHVLPACLLHLIHIRTMGYICDVGTPISRSYAIFTWYCAPFRLDLLWPTAQGRPGMARTNDLMTRMRSGRGTRK